MATVLFFSVLRILWSKPGVDKGANRFSIKYKFEGQFNVDKSRSSIIQVKVLFYVKYNLHRNNLLLIRLRNL